MKKWRLIEEETIDSAWNMAVDDALLYIFKDNDLPILRIYQWPQALSFGRFSNPFKTIDLSLAEKYRISCVRRITGGGILIHGGDISYSLILPSSFAKEHGVKGGYRYLCRFLIHLYEKMGLKAAFATEVNIPQTRSEVCLAGHEAYDIVIGGKKIGGNAQRHIRSAMLQHGSIPLLYDRELFEPLFLKTSGFGSSTSLKELGKSESFETVKNMVKESFCETFDANFMENGLTPCEMKTARDLYEKKYRQNRWNLEGRE
ncbi:lipoate--protein ligase family protein [Hydrogenimonas sp.]